MSRIKRVFSLVLLSLISCVCCLAACSSKSLVSPDEGNEEGSLYGIYTNLTLSLDGGDGQVWATVKNRFTLFPSVVTVKVELYNSETYRESYADMNLVASNYISDLNQGKSVTAVAETEGRASYWKARAYYKIDSDGWKEYLTNTVLLDKYGIITSSDDTQEYYISDFLSVSTVEIRAGIYPYVFGSEGDSYRFVGTAYCYIESEEELQTVKNLFGEVKLDTFDMNAVIDGVKASQFFTAASANPSFLLQIQYSNGNIVYININDIYKKSLGVNLYLYYSDGEFHQYFTALLSDETKQVLIDLIKNIYES